MYTGPCHNLIMGWMIHQIIVGRAQQSVKDDCLMENEDEKCDFCFVQKNVKHFESIDRHLIFCNDNYFGRG